MLYNYRSQIYKHVIIQAASIGQAPPVFLLRLEIRLPACPKSSKILANLQDLQGKAGGRRKPCCHSKDPVECRPLSTQTLSCNFSRHFQLCHILIAGVSTIRTVDL